MSALLGAIAPETARREASRQVAVGVARDAMAARMIADAAEAGNPAAAAFADEAQEILGAASVRKARASRLRYAAAVAAAGGYHGLSRCGSDAALVEERAADRLAASVCQAVRESHAYGYLSPEESRLLQQKTRLESMTQSQLEQGFADLLKKIEASSINFGDDTDDADEVGDDSSEQVAMAAQLFGGDLPAVFGVSCYGAFGALFKVSAERLMKRLAKKRKLLAKLTSKLEEKEDADKKGLGVKVLRLRVNKLEKSISKIKEKLKKLGKAADDVESAAKESAKVEKAETQAVKEAVKDEDDDLQDEEADEEVGAALELFGARPRRVFRATRRARRLRALASRARSPGVRRKLVRRANAIMGRLALARRPIRPAGSRPAMLRRRRFRRHAPVVVTSSPVYVDEDPAFFEEGDSVYVPVASYEDEDEDDEDDRDDEAAYGAATGLPPHRAALVGFFANRASSYGADVSDDATFGDGFFAQIGEWFRRLLGRGEAAVQQQRTAAQAAREARAPLTPSVVRARREVQSERRELREVTKARREAGRRAYKQAGGKLSMPNVSPIPSQQARSRVVRGAGGYVYQVNADSSVTILKSPDGRGEGRTLTSGKAYDAIVAEVSKISGDAGPIESFFRAPRGERGAALARQADRLLSRFSPDLPGMDEEDDLDEDDLDEEGGDEAEMGATRSVRW